MLLLSITIRENVTEIVFLFSLLFSSLYAFLLGKGSARGQAKRLNQSNGRALGRPLIARHSFSLMGCSCSHPSGPH